MKRFITLLLFIPIISFCQSPNDSIVVAIGDKIDQTLYEGDASYVNAIFDMEKFTNLFTRKSDDPTIKAFNKGFADNFSMPLAKQIISEINKGAYYDFITYFELENDRYIVLFRLYTSEGGLNYHEYFLTKNEKGEYYIEDVYLYLSGERLSVTLGRLYNMAIESMKEEEANVEVLSSFMMLKKVKELQAAGDIKGALQTFQSIPEDFKKEKLFKLLELELLSSTNDNKSYLKVMQEYEALFPKDPSLYLVSIDKFTLDEDYDKALEMVDSLYLFTEDDFLDFYRGTFYFLKDDNKKAINHFKSLYENYPYFSEGYDGLLTVYEIEGKNEEAIEVLERFMEVFEIERQVVYDMMKKDYPLIYKSDIFQEWTKQK